MMMSAVTMTPTNGINRSNWDAFYSSWLGPLLFIIGIAILTALVLITISGLLTRFLVEPTAQAWGTWRYRASLTLGVGCVLTVAVFLPVYPIFHPFGAGWWLVWAYSFGVVPLGVALIGLASWPRLGDKQGTTRPVLPRIPGAIIAAVWVVLTCWFYTWGRGQHLLAADVTLGVLGVLATTISLGQNRRLQVEARTANGTVDTAATDYLLCRLQKLGSRPPEALSYSQTTDLSRLASQDFSTVPGGAIASAAARILYAVRPGLTWRAQITQVDTERLTVQVSRNSRLVKTAVISRPDLGLETIPDSPTDNALTEKQDRAKAQLLTGAAACVLLEMSFVHPPLRRGLCGATQWKSVALHVIATEPALAEDPNKNIALLRESTDADPGYALGRLDYLIMRYHQTTPKTADVRRQFARLLNVQLRHIPGGASHAPEAGYEVMYLRILYRMTAMRINACMMALIDNGMNLEALRSGQEFDETELAASAEALVKQCEEQMRKARTDQEISDYATNLYPMATNLWNAARYLTNGTTVSNNSDEYRAPDIAVHDAARIGLLAEFTDQASGRFATVLDLLAFGVEDYLKILDDPSFWLPRLRAAVLPQARFDMFSLAPFSPYADALRKVGITTFEQFQSQVTAQPQKFATYLSIDELVVVHLADIAGLAMSRTQLNDADVLAVFIGADITSQSDLNRRLSADKTNLIDTLRRVAAEQGRKSLPAIQVLETWLCVPTADHQLEPAPFRIRRDHAKNSRDRDDRSVAAPRSHRGDPG